jgi:hypothetical protein
MKTKQRYAPLSTQTGDKALPKDSLPASGLGEMSGSGVVIGKLVGFSAAGQPLVAFDLDSAQHPQEAISLAVLAEANVGCEVVLSFAQNRNDHPVIMGVVQSHFVEEAGVASTMPELLVNGEKLNITAAKEITLRCGKSSITLTESGKILIKGEHILSRAAGANRVKGGSIQLN